MLAHFYDNQIKLLIIDTETMKAVNEIFLKKAIK
jgi:hypothetical protein